MSGFIASTAGAPGRIAAPPAWQSATPSRALAPSVAQLTWTSADPCGENFSVAGITTPMSVLPLFETAFGTVSRATVGAAALRRAAEIDSTHNASTFHTASTFDDGSTFDDEYRLRGHTRWRPV